MRPKRGLLREGWLPKWHPRGWRFLFCLFFSVFFCFVFFVFFFWLQPTKIWRKPPKSGGPFKRADQLSLLTEGRMPSLLSLVANVP